MLLLVLPVVLPAVWGRTPAFRAVAAAMAAAAAAAAAVAAAAATPWAAKTDFCLASGEMCSGLASDDVCTVPVYAIANVYYKTHFFELHSPGGLVGAMVRRGASRQPRPSPDPAACRLAAVDLGAAAAQPSQQRC